MIASCGLLNTDGLDHFYDVFHDYEMLNNKSRPADEYLCKDLTPLGDADGSELARLVEQRKREFRTWLAETVSCCLGGHRKQSFTDNAPGWVDKASC
jgi:hypothetical protein